PHVVALAAPGRRDAGRRPGGIRSPERRGTKADRRTGTQQRDRPDGGHVHPGADPDRAVRQTTHNNPEYLPPLDERGVRCFGMTIDFSAPRGFRIRGPAMESAALRSDEPIRVRTDGNAALPFALPDQPPCLADGTVPEARAGGDPG